MAKGHDTRRLGAPAVFDERDAEVIDITPSSETDLDRDIDAEENKITSEFDADSQDVSWLIKVYKKNKKTGTMDYLFQCLPSDLPIVDKLRDEYTPPGETEVFKARVYRSGEGRGKALYRVLEYSIHSPKNQVAAVSRVESDVKSVMENMATTQRELIEMVRTTRVQPTADPMDNMIKMATAMGAMMQAFKPAITPAPTSDPSALLPMMLEFMKFGRESVSGSQPEGSNFIDLARDLFKAVGPVLPAMMANAQAAQVQRPITAPQKPAVTMQPANTDIQPSGPGVSDNSTVSTNEVPSVFPPDILMIVKSQLPSLINKAQRNSDPNLYADFILDNVPLDIVEQYLNDDNFVTNLIAVDGRVATYRPWFDALHTSIREALTPDEQDANTSINVSETPTNLDTDGNPGGESGD